MREMSPPGPVRGEDETHVLFQTRARLGVGDALRERR